MKSYTVKQVAEMLQTNPETVRRWIRSNKLKADRKSKKEGNIIWENELEKFLKSKPKYSAAALIAGGGILSLSALAPLPVLLFPGVIGAIASAVSMNSNMDKKEEIKKELEKETEKLQKSISQKKSLIRQTQKEIDDLTEKVDQYQYYLEHEELLEKIIGSENKEDE